MKCCNEGNLTTIMGTVRGYSRRDTHGLGRSCVNIGVQAIVVYFCALALSPSIQAAEFSCSQGDVACLIDRINIANSNGQSNTITLANGNYILRRNAEGLLEDGLNGLPSIKSTLTIRGQGPNSTTISRDTAMETFPFRIFHVADEGSLTLMGLSVVNGLAETIDVFLRPAAGSGGGIFVRGAGNLDLNDVFLVENKADNFGGAVFAGNVVFSQGGLLPVQGAGEVTVTKSCMCRNHAGGDGGGIYTQNLTIMDSLFEGNTAGREGGGIFSFFADIRGSTISFNEAESGGGISFSRSLTNSTISSNIARVNGGGIIGAANLLNVTISDNVAAGQGGGIFIDEVTGVKNTLIVKNFIGTKDGNVITRTEPSDCTFGEFLGIPGELLSGGHNIDSDGSCELGATGDQTVSDTLLGPLARYDETLTDLGTTPLTPTQGLLPLPGGNPAIDTADCAEMTDQRGVIRPQGSGCEVGAWEANTTVLIANVDLSLTNRSTSTNPADTRGGDCPEGVFTVSATFQNESTTPLSNLFFEVLTLTNGNSLLGAVGGIPPGGPGAIIGVPVVLQNRLVAVLPICLASPNEMDFTVNALGAKGPP